MDIKYIEDMHFYSRNYVMDIKYILKERQFEGAHHAKEKQFTSTLWRHYRL